MEHNLRQQLEPQTTAAVLCASIHSQEKACGVSSFAAATATFRGARGVLTLARAFADVVVAEGVGRAPVHFMLTDADGYDCAH